ncbi:MAG: hypothetical protein Q8N03_00480 [Ignavibacteria bacterium]|nr:hypothetical protein [Ignavibacteria bacterium]
MKTIQKDKKKAVLIGILSGLLSLIFVPALFKAALSDLIYGRNYLIEWHFPFLNTSIEIVKNAKPLTILILIFSPIIFGFLSIEISGIYIKLRKDFLNKISGILFQLVQITYILILIIYFAITVIFNLFPESEITKFIEVLNYSFEKKMIALFVTILIPFTYTSFALNRIKNYFSESEKES